MTHVFLDLDGTLTESGIGITRSIAHALEAMGHPVPPQAVLDQQIGPSLWDCFAGFGMDRADQDRAVALYRERYTTVGLFENRVYDGIAEMLVRLGEAGCMLHLATAKPIAYAKKITAHFDIGRHLTREFGSELDGTRTDKTELIAHALTETGASPAASFMIGDRHHDMIGALNNGLTPVGALWGYGQPGELSDAGCTDIVANPAEAADLILRRLE
ncbi:MAG: HAD hydrolase-like protein [Pseudomonadota bacterium]